MRKFGVIFGLIGLVIATSIGITFWTALNNEKNEKVQIKSEELVDLQKAQELIASDKVEEALPIIAKYRSQNEPFSEHAAKWVDLYIKANEKEKNIPELIVLFQFYPEAFRNNEDAALIIANEFLLENKENEFISVRSLFKGNETKENSWFILDADLLLLQNRSDEAISLLKSRSFSGDKDVPRLIRLAALRANENPKEAWGYLTEAYNKDPNNVDLRTFRAQLLENGGKPEQARSEYLAAMNMLPNNLYIKDQLADFYIRQKEYESALDIWKTHLASPSLESIWVKALFWSKVIQPVSFNWKNGKIPPGHLEPLISYYINLNYNQFWDSHTYSNIERGDEFLKHEQSTFWLRLLQDLKDNNENEALNLLNYNSFAHTSWNPDLETALKHVIKYRKEASDVSHEENVVIINNNSNNSLQFPHRKELVKQINKLFAKNQTMITQNLHDLLVSKEVYTALFLSSDWSQAALQLDSLEIIPQNLPQWIVPGLFNAISKNQGTQKALDYAAKQPTTPALTLMLSQLFMEKNDYQKAKKTILMNPEFAQSTRGQELLARIALSQNDKATADNIYSSIETASPEARSYLAKKAYSEKNWKKARELTETLIRDYPNDEQLKKNLAKIISEENQRK